MGVEDLWRWKMAKKKRADKEKSKKKDKETKTPEAIDAASTISLTPEMLKSLDISPNGGIRISPSMSEALRLGAPSAMTISPSMFEALGLGAPSAMTISPSMLEALGLGLDPNLATQSIKLEQDLEDKINSLRQENRKLVQEVADKTKALEREEVKIDELKETIEQLRANEKEMSQQQRLQHLFYRVHPLAWEKLKEDEKFRQLFEQKKPCPAVIMSIDIRRSTELMLKARDAELYASFIISLCTQLKQIILKNYGVFDKFTGDGILAFFPEFYSGADAAYLAVKAADECHAYFFKHYENNRNCFTIILKDVGLGIGIDCGESYLVNIQDWLTVIGTPVVYACRFSGDEAGQTLLNQQAYEVTSQKFGEYINFQESEIKVKHEGRALAYVATLSKKTYEPRLPDWLTPPTSPKS
jgi:class 3 adenylate cyclase